MWVQQFPDRGTLHAIVASDRSFAYSCVCIVAKNYIKASPNVSSIASTRVLTV